MVATGRLWRALQRIARRRNLEPDGGSPPEPPEAGFTLIQLMVVMLVMAVLLAIAVPTLLGASTVTNDRSTQSDVYNVAVSAQALYEMDSGFPAQGVPITDALEAAEPEMEFISGTPVTGSEAHPHYLDLRVSADGNVLVAAEQAPDGYCWNVEVNLEPTPSTDGVINATAAQGISYSGSQSVQASCGTETNMHNGPAGWGRSFPTP